MLFARAESEGKHDKVAWGKFVHFNSKYKIHSTVRDELGRYIVIDTELLNRRMPLGNVYGPSNGDRPEFFEEVFNKITSFDNNELIVVGGDWNVAVNNLIPLIHPIFIEIDPEGGYKSLLNNATLLIFFEVCILILESTHGEGSMVPREANWIILLFLNSLVWGPVCENCTAQ